MKPTAAHRRETTRMKITARWAEATDGAAIEDYFADEIIRLRDALQRYANCRHGQPSCFCTREAEEALRL